MIPHIILQTGNTTNVGSAINQVFNAAVSPFFQGMLMIGGIAFLIGIAMLLYNVFEYVFHFTSWGRTAALNEVINHGKRLIFGALTLWLAIYVIALILELGGVPGVNPAQLAGQVFTAEFKWLYYYLSKAIQHATSTTP